MSVGLKKHNLIGLLQHKSADMKRISEATIHSIENNQTRACQLGYLKVNLKFQITPQLAKLSPVKTPKGYKLQTITINSMRAAFLLSRPVYESVIFVR